MYTIGFISINCIIKIIIYSICRNILLCLVSFFDYLDHLIDKFFIKKNNKNKNKDKYRLKYKYKKKSKKFIGNKDPGGNKDPRKNGDFWKKVKNIFYFIKIIFFCYSLFYLIFYLSPDNYYYNFLYYIRIYMVIHVLSKLIFKNNLTYIIFSYIIGNKIFIRIKNYIFETKLYRKIINYIKSSKLYKYIISCYLFILKKIINIYIYSYTIKSEKLSVRPDQRGYKFGKEVIPDKTFMSDNAKIAYKDSINRSSESLSREMIRLENCIQYDLENIRRNQELLHRYYPGKNIQILPANTNIRERAFGSASERFTIDSDHMTAHCHNFSREEFNIIKPTIEATMKHYRDARISIIHFELSASKLSVMCPGINIENTWYIYRTLENLHFYDFL